MGKLGWSSSDSNDFTQSACNPYSGFVTTVSSFSNSPAVELWAHYSTPRNALSCTRERSMTW